MSGEGGCESPALRVGLVGCGRIGFLLEDDPLRGHPCTHAGAIAADPATRLVAACDIDCERLAEIGRRYRLTSLYGSHLEMIRAESLDLLIVASWTATHAPVVLDACRAGGIRGILCEKPLSPDLLSADRMIDACRESGVALVVNHERRFASDYRTARRLINDGTIGDLRTIVGNVLSPKWTGRATKEDPAVSGGGPLLHDGTHLIDLMRFLAGEVDSVSADQVWDRDSGSRVETTSVALLRFTSGAFGLIETGGDRRYFNFELDIQGSLGRIRIGNGILGFERSGTSRYYTGFEDLIPAEFPPFEAGTSNGYVGAIEDLVDCVRTGRPSLSSGEDGRAAIEIIQAIYASAARGGQRLRLPLDRELLQS